MVHKSDGDDLLLHVHVTEEMQKPWTLIIVHGIFWADSKDKIAPDFTWKPIMNGLNTDMVYSSEHEIFDIQTRDIMYNPPT